MRPAADQLGALSLVAVGALLGSGGLAILTPRVLELIDPAVPLALAAVGILAGLDSTAFDRTQARRATATSAGGLLTAVLVAGGLFAAARLLPDAAVPVVALAAVAGSGAMLASPAPRPLAITVAAIAVAGIRDGTMASLPLIAHTAAIAALMAFAGWLLMTSHTSPIERRVFMVATLLLIGGASDYLAMPALFGGLVAGICWRRAGPGVRDTAAIDVAALHQPLAALLLLVAGALAAFSLEVLALAVAFALLRMAGDAGLRLATGQPPRAPSPDVSAALSPLVLAIAPALTAVRAVGPDLAPALAVVVAGTVLYGLCLWAWMPREATA
jgi:hypothetical protein